MNQSGQLRSKLRQATIAWISLVLSGPIMLGAVYLVQADFEASLPAEYELYFFVGGALSGLASLIGYRNFRRAVQAQAANAEAYMQRMMQAMMLGMSLADIPFFIGLMGWVVGGFMRTALALAVLTVLLQLRLKPPSA